MPVCTCGHYEEEHYSDDPLNEPNSSVCHGDIDESDECDCSAFEEDYEDDGEEEDLEFDEDDEEED